MSHTTNLAQNMQFSFLDKICSPALQRCYKTLAQHYLETDPTDYDFCDKQAAKIVESLGMVNKTEAKTAIDGLSNGANSKQCITVSVILASKFIIHHGGNNICQAYLTYEECS